MAGIGDYIHATRIHYLEHSVNLYKKEIPPRPQEIYNTQIAMMKQEVARKKFENNLAGNREELEKMLNLFFNPAIKTNLGKGELNEKDIQTMQAAFSDYMENMFGKHIYLNYNTLSVSSGIDVSNLTQEETELLEAIKSFNNYKMADKRSIQKIEERYAALIKFRDNVAKNKISPDLYRRLQDLDSKYKDFQKDVAAYMQASKNTKVIWRYWLRKNEKHQRFDDELNELIKALKLTSAGKAQGEFGEIVAKAGNYVLNYKGRISKNQLLKFLIDSKNKTQKSRKGVKGSLLSYYALYRDEDKMFDDSGNRLSLKQLQQDEFTVNLTEDKVDATLYFEDFGNINTSIKNYNLSTEFAHLKLLEGKNLLGLVQDYSYFINHFLNIVGTHTDTNFSPNDINKMHEAMKITAFVKAISGGVFTDRGYSEKVDLFIVNDTSVNGGYKVYYLSELLDKIIGNIELMNFSKYPDGIWTENDWVAPDYIRNRASSAKRITKLINKMKTMSLLITISPNALK